MKSLEILKYLGIYIYIYMLSLVITNLLSASFFDDDIIFMTIIGIIFFGYIYIYIYLKKYLKQNGLLFQYF